jgi:hypothetical protein
MRPQPAKATIVRWKLYRHVVAYSYTLIPVAAHRAGGKWVVDSEAACVFTATFIDDKGDGVFRVLVPVALTQTWSQVGQTTEKRVAREPSPRSCFRKFGFRCKAAIAARSSELLEAL